jgi:PAS domain S-box-containing protein
MASAPTGESHPRLSFLLKAGHALARGDDFFRELLDVLPAAIYVTDEAGRITYYNEAAAALWGHRPQLYTSEWCGSWKLFWPDGRVMPHAECPMAIALRQKRPVLGMEAVAERPDGTRVPFTPFPIPLYDTAGKLIGAVNLLVDITDRKCAEHAALQLAAIVESSDDAIVSKDLDGMIQSWNRGAERLFGYSAEEVIGKPVTILIPPDRLDEEPQILQRLRRGERVDHYETIRRRKDGSVVDISLTVSPLKDHQGRVIGASKIARDISHRKRAQEQERLLAAEMKHRIKNSLLTVQALATQTLHTASAEEKEAFTARLHAIASAHDLMTVDSWDRIPVRSVVLRALEPFRVGPLKRVLTEGPDGIWLSATKALLLAMALHELATNAVKYGALSNAIGRVHISWQVHAQANRITLSWGETGGPQVRAPEREGFGSRLIKRAMKGGLGSARLDYRPEGLACALEMAL